MPHLNPVEGRSLAEYLIGELACVVLESPYNLEIGYYYDFVAALMSSGDDDEWPPNTTEGLLLRTQMEQPYFKIAWEQYLRSAPSYTTPHFSDVITDYLCNSAIEKIDKVQLKVIEIAPHLQTVKGNFYLEFEGVGVGKAINGNWNYHGVYLGQSIFQYILLNDPDELEPHPDLRRRVPNFYQLNNNILLERQNDPPF